MQTWWAIVLYLMLAAALPPLGPDEQMSRATHVVDGVVLNVRPSEVEVSQGKDREYRLNFRIDNKVKGSLRAGLTVTVILRQTGQRLAGWAGPQGQNEIPAERQKVRFYPGEEGDLFPALEPNGWDSTRSLVHPCVLTVRNWVM